MGRREIVERRGKNEGGIGKSQKHALQSRIRSETVDKKLKYLFFDEGSVPIEFLLNLMHNSCTVFRNDFFFCGGELLN